MKQLFMYITLGASFFMLLLYGCSGTQERKPITVLRQFTGLNSGIKLTEYHTFFTQDEINSFLAKKTKEGNLVPDIGFTGISNTEICLLVFTGTSTRTYEITTKLEEEQDRIIFRVDATGPQIILPLETECVVIKNTDGSIGIDYVQKPKTSGYEQTTTTPFGYFVLPKTNKKIVIEQGGLIQK